MLATFWIDVAPRIVIGIFAVIGFFGASLALFGLGSLIVAVRRDRRYQDQHPGFRCEACGDDSEYVELVGDLRLCPTCSPFHDAVDRMLRRERHQELAAVTALHPRTGQVLIFPTDKSATPGADTPGAA